MENRVNDRWFGPEEPGTYYVPTRQFELPIHIVPCGLHDLTMFTPGIASGFPRFFSLTSYGVRRRYGGGDEVRDLKMTVPVYLGTPHRLYSVWVKGYRTNG